MEKGAIISDCGQFRYRLWRRWSSNVHPHAAFVMLNPSTADAEKDDATIRKCIGFAQRWGGYNGIEVVNLFAYRATKPADLKKAGYPVGPDNMKHITKVCDSAGIVICAWGRNGHGHPQVKEVLAALAAMKVKLHVLDLTNNGDPSHPLMLSYSCKPMEYWALGLNEN